MVSYKLTIDLHQGIREDLSFLSLLDKRICKMNYEKFDVEKALSGEPVILRNGSKAFIRYKEEEFKMGLPLVGIDLGRERWETWMLSGSVYTDGVYSNGKDYDYDIVGMYPKEPLAMPDSFWDMLTPEAVAIAKDNSGIWFGFQEVIPEFGEEGIWVGSEHYWLGGFNPKLFPKCEPKDSLILRPS